MPECLDKNTSKITASIFLNFFSENSQVVASRHLPQHGAARKTDPSQSNQTQKIGFGPRFLVGFFPPYRAKLGACCPTRRDHRGVFCPLLCCFSRSGVTVGRSLSEFPRTGGLARITNSQHFKSKQSNLPGEKKWQMFVKSERLKGLIKKRLKI